MTDICKVERTTRMSDKPIYERDNDFERYRLYMIKVASQLCYPKEVMNRIRHAKSEIEISQIMVSARRKL